MLLLTVFPFFISTLRTATARADWEPWPNAYESLSPGNDVAPQTGPMPFKLKIDDVKTQADGCIYVTLEGNETNEFAGFMLQARNESDIAIGKFRPATDIKLIDCFGMPENTAININYLPKEEVIVRWFPEEKDQGSTVRMVATIAQDYLEQVYWLKQTSGPIKILPPKYPTIPD